MFSIYMHVYTVLVPYLLSFILSSHPPSHPTGTNLPDKTCSTLLLNSNILSEVIQVRKTKVYMSLLSHVEYRPNTNISKIMKNRSWYGETMYKRGRIKEGS
jgi:hypothetical protein